MVCLKYMILFVSFSKNIFHCTFAEEVPVSISFYIKGIVSRDFEWLQMILINRLCDLR